ncbi:MAG TPA: site-specific integrase [Nitrospinota bacterium]|nr:site-specific integrase [Nitrospinota bacterium]
MQTQQHFTLDQIKALVKVGLLKNPSNNDLASSPEMPYPSDISNHNSGGLCMEGKVVFNKGRWKIDFRRRQIGGYITRDKRGGLFWSKEHAGQALNAIRYEITNHTFDIERYKKSSITDWQFDNRWKAFLQAGCDRKKTPWSPSYKQKLKEYYNQHFHEYFSTIDIRDIEDINIDQFYHSLPKNLSLQTKKNIIISLRSFLYRHKEIRKKQLEFPNPKINEPVIKWIGQSEQDRIFEHIPEVHKPIFYFLRWHGARPGEARALKWDCVDLQKREVIIKRTFSYHKLMDITKGKKDRIIPLFSEFIPMLKEQPKGFGNNFVFRNQKGGHYGTNILPRLWREAMVKAGLAPIRLYDGTRHSCASQLEEAGAPLDYIQALLGHSDRKMTKRYAHGERVRLAKIIELHKR